VSITELKFDITPQPDETTCGPACLHAVYRYYGLMLPVERVIAEVPQLPTGGSLAVTLARHALDQGFAATIYTYDLQIFDPSWFEDGSDNLRAGLRAQLRAKDDLKLQNACRAYIQYLDHGGSLVMRDLTPALVWDILRQGLPIIAALSATWLYRCKRERPHDHEADDAQGEPVGHFVVIRGLDLDRGIAHVADPNLQVPYPASLDYEVDVYRLISAILLGIVTYDAKLLVIRPVGAQAGGDPLPAPTGQS